MTILDNQKHKIIELYTKELESILVIAEKYSTYPNKIRRLLINNGVTMRSKSESQKIALKNGRHGHPTKGKKRSNEVKVKISESIHGYWENIQPDDYKKRSDKAKENWDKMSEQQKDDLRKLSGQGIREAAKFGSKIELFLFEELTQNNVTVVFHKKGLIPRQDLEVDLFIPQINAAIEIDGPSHFLPIWGEENLQKHIAADARKNGLLIATGFKVIRIKNLAKRVTKKLKRDILKLVLDIVKDIDSGKATKKYFELEIK